MVQLHMSKRFLHAASLALYIALRCGPVYSATAPNEVATTTLRTAISETNLGSAYDHGDGVPVSASRAVYWYRKAARHGYVKAQFNLAADYYTGRGVVQNYIKANYWFKKAAMQGYVWAERFLGEDYYHGLGTPKNDSRAFYWLQKAADQGLHTFALSALQNLQIEHQHQQNQQVQRPGVWIHPMPFTDSEGNEWLGPQIIKPAPQIQPPDQ